MPGKVLAVVRSSHGQRRLGNTRRGWRAWLRRYNTGRAALLTWFTYLLIYLPTGLTYVTYLRDSLYIGFSRSIWLIGVKREHLPASPEVAGLPRLPRYQEASMKEEKKLVPRQPWTRY